MNQLPELLIASNVSIAGRIARLAPSLQLSTILVDPKQLTQAARGKSVVAAVIAIGDRDAEVESIDLRTLIADLDLPILAFTTPSTPALAREALLAGAAELVLEPVSDEELLRVLQECLAVAVALQPQPLAGPAAIA